VMVALIGSLAGCRHADPSGQWILESYNADSGYVFRKDGVHYKANCCLIHTRLRQ